MNAPLAPAVLTTQHEPANYANLTYVIPRFYSNNPARDAAEHFDALADTFIETIEYRGLTLDVEINRHSRQVDSIFCGDEDMSSDFSDYAMCNIVRLAMSQANTRSEV